MRQEIQRNQKVSDEQKVESQGEKSLLTHWAMSELQATGIALVGSFVLIVIVTVVLIVGWSLPKSYVEEEWQCEKSCY